MTKQILHRLPVVERLDGDQVISSRQLASIEKFSVDDVLICGDCGDIIAAHLTVEEAHNIFSVKTGRAITKCASCEKFNLIHPKIDK